MTSRSVSRPSTTVFRAARFPRAAASAAFSATLATTFTITLTAAIFAAALAGCVAVEEEPEAQPDSVKRMFASTQLVSGNLGGLAGADALCANWAGAADLGGTWKAFLSTTGTGAVNAPSRIAEVGPWYNVTRQYKMFNNKAGFSVGVINPIRTEYNVVASGNAWTGTKADGTADGLGARQLRKLEQRRRLVLRQRGHARCHPRKRSRLDSQGRQRARVRRGLARVLFRAIGRKSRRA